MTATAPRRRIANVRRRSAAIAAAAAAAADESAEFESAPGSCRAGDESWWWGCNVCWCVAAGEAPACTRLWCGLADCLALETRAADGASARCRADEVCVPVAGSLCLRPPCAAPGECRRVSGRRVEPPPLPAPPHCWPTQTRPGPACGAASLELARERLSPGAHVERACQSLRRALAAALATGTDPLRAARSELVLLCDLSPDDDDVLDLALVIFNEIARMCAFVIFRRAGVERSRCASVSDFNVKLCIISL